MKKKLIPLILTPVFVITCAVGVAACKKKKDCIGIIATYETSGKVSNIDLGDYVYGEDDKISADLAKVKFYKHFDDGTDEEISVSELNVERKSSVNGEDISENGKYYCRDGNSVWYSFEYSLSGTTNTVQVGFDVEPATRDDFSITLSKTQWRYGENSATVTLKNFNGTVMQSNEIGSDMKKDDTDYNNLNLYALRKETYENLTTENKKNYELFTTTEQDDAKPNYGYNKYFGSDLKYYSPDADQYQMTLSPNEYVLIACVGNTNNYKNIVCTAEFTVGEPDSPIGKTSVLTDVTAYIYEDGERKPVPDEEVMAMAANLKETNLNATAICDADGKVTGTCDFGFGAFGSLTGDDAFTMTFDPVELRVEVKNNNGMNLSGFYINETLTLSVQQPLMDDGGTQMGYYTLEFTFALQKAVS